MRSFVKIKPLRKISEFTVLYLPNDKTALTDVWSESLLQLESWFIGTYRAHRKDSAQTRISWSSLGTYEPRHVISNNVAF